MAKHSWLHFFKIQPKDGNKSTKNNKKEIKAEKKEKQSNKAVNEQVQSSTSQSQQSSDQQPKSDVIQNEVPASPNTGVILDASEQPQDTSTSSKETRLKKKEQFNAPSVLAKPIIIQFLYQKKKIANDYIFTGEIGQALDLTKIPAVTGYDLPDANKLNYSVTDHTQVVPIEMRPQLIHYRLVPVTEDREVIDKKYIKSLNGQPGESIVFSNFPQIPGYQAYTTRIYIVPDKSDDLQITYAPVQQSLTVVFITTSGVTLGEQTLHGKTGDPYRISTKEHHFEGYTLSKDDLPTNLEGNFEPGNQIVTLKYKPVESGVTISFIDERGNAIHKPLTFPGAYGESYHLNNLPPIDGYKLFSDPTLLIGKFDVKMQQIVLKYQRAEQKVKVRFWFDEKHTVSAGEDKILTGLTDDSYKMQVPVLDGYHPSTQIISGRFKVFSKKIFDIVYQPIKTVIKLSLQDEGGRQLPNVQSLTKTGVYGESYTFDLPDISGYVRPQEKISGKFYRPQDTIIVNYRPKQATLTINYLDSRTKKPIPNYNSETINGLVGTAYSIEPKMINGFKLTELPKEASGVYKRAQDVVNFLYHPNPAKIIIHQVDQANNTLFEPFELKGYFGDPYNIKPDELKGYAFESSSDKLSGVYPETPKDIYLYYKAEVISFTLAPANQMDKVIDKKYNLTISGMVGQQFSNGLPEIPGYSPKNANRNIGGTIKSAMADKILLIEYEPDDAQAIIHFACAGGPRDGSTPFEDYPLNGKVAEQFKYTLPEIPGYHTNTPVLTGTFTPETIDLNVVYEVNQITYSIHYVTDQGQEIFTTAPTKASYGQTLDVMPSLPEGYHLPSGSSNEIVLNNNSDYNIVISPDSIIAEVIAKTKDGKELNYRRQINGFYHQPQTFPAPHLNGYQPVDGNELTINFELGQKEIPVIYEPEKRSITVRYIDTQGNNLSDPTVISGYFDEPYKIEAKKFAGFVVINQDSTRTGKFGLNNSDTTFIYRAGSDEINPAITPLDDMLINKEVDTDTNYQTVAEDNSNNPDNTANQSTTIDTPDNLFSVNQGSNVGMDDFIDPTSANPTDPNGTISRIIHGRN